MLVVVALRSSDPRDLRARESGDFRAPKAREVGLVTLAMMTVVISGGIDLSVGSNFALGNFVTFYLLNLLHWPVWATVPCAILACGLGGSLQRSAGLAYLRLRAFFDRTLVTLIIVRALVDILLLQFAQAMSITFFSNDFWGFFVGAGGMGGVPTSFLAFALVGLIGHIILSRGRPGWRAMAIGGSRRSAHNIGISVRRTVCSTYVISGMLCGLASVLYAARLGGVGTDTGSGLEISTLTAVVLGEH